MKKVLVISGHPDLKISTANAAILAELAEKLPDAEIRKLDELYPDYQFDVAAEQAALVKADVIVFQFPFHWSSVPGLLKLYIDKIFLHSWAYGSSGKALVGKKLIFSATIGAPENLYQKDASFRHEPPEFGYFLEQFAALCNMTCAPMIYTCGMMYVPGVSPDSAKAEVIAKAKAQAQRVVEAVKND
ncbi:MAG: NAD(P)H-dependent oxidoreductase [Selenomonadaceae bacterium]|nr:NAD(P)H-dependent oxidoreductase [Selenomonadaceae bacterium]